VRPTGLQTGPLVVESPGQPCTVLGLRLHPAGAYALLGRPLGELSGTTVDFEDLVGRAAAELAARLDEAPAAGGRLRRVAAWVEARLARSPGAAPAVAWTDGQIEPAAARCRSPPCATASA
jgi:hypothetical protein